MKKTFNIFLVQLLKEFFIRLKQMDTGSIILSFFTFPVERLSLLLKIHVNYVCDVILGVYQHQASLKNIRPGHALDRIAQLT
jgi:hypothetical protein